MSVMHVIWSIVTGFVIGLIARALLPGADHFGFWVTALVGITGSWVGGYIGSLISEPPGGAAFHPAGFVMSVLGAIVLLMALRAFG